MGGFKFLLILDLWGISFHAVIVFGLGKNLLFKSVLGHCELLLTTEFKEYQRKWHPHPLYFYFASFHSWYI